MSLQVSKLLSPCVKKSEVSLYLFEVHIPAGHAKDTSCCSVFEGHYVMSTSSAATAVGNLNHHVVFRVGLYQNSVGAHFETDHTV